MLTIKRNFKQTVVNDFSFKKVFVFGFLNIFLSYRDHYKVLFCLLVKYLFVLFCIIFFFQAFALFLKVRIFCIQRVRVLKCSVYRCDLIMSCTKVSVCVFFWVFFKRFYFILLRGTISRLHQNIELQLFHNDFFTAYKCIYFSTYETNENKSSWT